MKIKCGCCNDACHMVMTLITDSDGEAVYISIHEDTKAAPDMVLKVKEAKKLRKYLRKYIDNFREKEENDEQKAG